MAPPVVNGILSTSPSQGETARLKWFYLDDSSSSVISPTGLALGSYIRDPSDLYRNPANTGSSSIGAAFAFTPALDVDGGYYVDVAFDNAAPTGQWYVQTTYTHEGVTRTQYLVFNVVSAGASAAGATALYCTVQDVQRFLFRNIQEFDANTVLSKLDVEEIIQNQMEVVDDGTQRSWHLNVATDELNDANFADKWRWHGDYIVSFQTTHRPIRSITSLKIIQGGREVDITTPGEDREATWYVDKRSGEVFLVATNIPTILRKGIMVSYTWGESTVPRSIRMATYYLAAAEILESEAFAVSLPEDSQTAGSVKDKCERWRDWAMERIDQQKALIYSTSGG